MENQSQVVLVPQTVKSGPAVLWLMHNKSQGLMFLPSATELDGIGQHLYFIVFDKLQKGDWYLYWFVGNHPSTGRVAQYLDGQLPKCNYAKIVGTTDTSLKLHTEIPDSLATEEYFDSSFYNRSLPLPQSQFLSYYVDMYNLGRQIEYVNLEYAFSKERYDSRGNRKVSNPVLKVTEGNKFNTNYQAKEFSRNEVIKLLHLAMDQAIDFHGTGANNYEVLKEEVIKDLLP